MRRSGQSLFKPRSTGSTSGSAGRPIECWWCAWARCRCRFEVPLLVPGVLLPIGNTPARGGLLVMVECHGPLVPANATGASAQVPCAKRETTGDGIKTLRDDKVSNSNVSGTPRVPPSSGGTRSVGC